jgi:benzoate-CoA ligase family protein
MKTTDRSTQAGNDPTAIGDINDDAPFNASEWLLDRHIEEGRGARVAVRYRGETFTYREVLDQVEQVAAGLRAAGVRPEERVAMVMLDSIEFIAVFLGAMRIGAVPLPINPLLPGRDLGVIIADARARMVVVSAERAPSLGDLVAGTPELERVVFTTARGDDDVATVLQAADVVGSRVTATPWNGLTAAGGDGSPYATWAASPGFWLCTSGSTGRPKLAMHRHIDLAITNDTYGRHVLSATADDRFFSVGPMFHAYGLGNSITFPLAVGATTVVESTRPPSPRLVADVMVAEKPTLFFCIPTFYAALNAADIPDDTFGSVRLGISAAEPLPPETFERFKERYGVVILDGIGSTEMLHIYLSNTEDQIRPGTSGVPVPGYEVKLIDETGVEQKPGEPGQLCVRGQSAAVGYWCRSEQSRSTFHGRWMHTGDLYHHDDDGYYAYMGRVDDMLRIGGEWVSPAEVEAILISHGDVLEAAVVGRKVDDVIRPVAYVIAHEGRSPSAEDLTEYCRERLAGYKRPKQYEFVDELPKTATGKIQRFKLR